MDYLKTRAPFWKREDGRSGTLVEAEARDETATARWRTEAGRRIAPTQRTG